MSPENSPNLQRKARPAPVNLIAGDPTVTLLIGFIALAVVVFGILSPGSFLSMDTVKSMAFQMPELGILSLAMMVPLMSGGLNLAIIATANLAGLVIAAVVTNLIQPSSPPLAVAGVIALAIVAGSITALAIGLATGIDRRLFPCPPDFGDAGDDDARQGYRHCHHPGNRDRGIPACDPVYRKRHGTRDTGVDDPLRPLRNCGRDDYESYPFRCCGAHDRVERKSHSLLRRRHRARVDRRVRFVQPALLRRGSGDDGSIQLRPRGICRVLPLDHYSGFRARRGRPIRRIRQGSRPLAFAVAAPSHLDRFQPVGIQSASDRGNLGCDPDSGDFDRTRSRPVARSITACKTARCHGRIVMLRKVKRSQ